LSVPETVALRSAVEEAQTAGRLKVGIDRMVENNDAIFAHECLEAICRDPRIVNFVRRLTGHPIELQHAKFNAKPERIDGGGEIKWHQDYPFYPHTNFDLVSCGIHLDDEDADSGPVRIIPGSHLWGVLSHCRNGEFVYECHSEDRDLEAEPSELLHAAAGFVTFHHCLTVHRSDAKRRPGHRRILVLQYRAQDAAQIAGVIWKSTGYPVEQTASPRYTRFPDGTRVEMRGDQGRLYDVYGRLAPDR